MKIRLFPTQEQERLMWNHVHQARFIWNWGLSLHNKRYEEGEKYLNAKGVGLLLTDVKHNDLLWLNEVSRHTQINVIRDLEKAFKSFFGSCDIYKSSAGL